MGNGAQSKDDDVAPSLGGGLPHAEEKAAHEGRGEDAHLVRVRVKVTLIGD